MGNDNRAPRLFPRLIGTGFGSGYSPVAPGTAGSLVGLGLFMLAGGPGPEGAGWGAGGLGPEGPGWGAVIVVMFALGVYVSGRIAQAAGPDPSIVVIDEIVGMWIALFMLPQSIWVIAGAFVLFRLLDIVKPPPARQSEKLPGGWGIMMDDLIAGVYTNLFIRLVLLFVQESA